MAAPLGLLWTANYEIEQRQTYILAETGGACVPRIIQVQGGQLCGRAQAGEGGVVHVDPFQLNQFTGTLHL